MGYALPPAAVAMNMGRRFQYKPKATKVYDTANSNQFHSRFLVNASRNETLVLGGNVRVRITTKSVTVAVPKLTSASRGSVLSIISTQCPLGGKIGTKRYSSAVLPRAVLSQLPGSVTVRR